MNPRRHKWAVATMSVCIIAGCSPGDEAAPTSAPPDRAIEDVVSSTADVRVSSQLEFDVEDETARSERRFTVVALDESGEIVDGSAQAPVLASPDGDALVGVRVPSVSQITVVSTGTAAPPIRRLYVAGTTPPDPGSILVSPPDECVTDWVLDQVATGSVSVAMASWDNGVLQSLYSAFAGSDPVADAFEDEDLTGSCDQLMAFFAGEASSAALLRDLGLSAAPG